MSQPFIEAAEKLKGPYKLALAEYERRKGSHSGEKPDAEAPRPKSTPTKKGGFTAVNASPLVVNPENESEPENEAQDEAAVAADLGGSQPSTSTSPSKRQRKDVSKHADGDSGKKDKKEKPKEKAKEKEKDKDKRRRRKSGKADS